MFRCLTVATAVLPSRDCRHFRCSFIRRHRLAQWTATTSSNALPEWRKAVDPEQSPAEMNRRRRAKVTAGQLSSSSSLLLLLLFGLLGPLFGLSPPTLTPGGRGKFGRGNGRRKFPGP